MQLITKSQAHSIQASNSTNFIEYFFSDKSMGGAYIEMNGRYPAKGFAINQVCSELAYILQGNGSISTKNSTANFQAGDSLFLPANEKFYWNGTFSMYVVTTPAFDPKQHKFFS